MDSIKQLQNQVFFPHPQKNAYLQQSLKERMRYYRIPGFAAAIIRDGNIANTLYEGVITRDTIESVKHDTIFLAGSISKSVTGYLCMILVDKGIIDLDTDIRDYLTSWQLGGSGSYEPAITIRHLLSHRAGITVHGFPGYPKNEKLATQIEVLNGKANTQSITIDILPELQFRYSGGGYTIVQVLLEDVTGISFEELAANHVFNPLNLRNSSFQQPLTGKMLGQVATGHHHTYGTPIDGGHYIYPEKAAAGLWTTPTDLARVFMDIQDAYHGLESTLSQESAKEMLDPKNNWDYHLGMNLEKLRGISTFGHGGWDEGFVSHVTFFKDERDGIVILTNKDFGSSNFIQELMNSIVRHYKFSAIHRPLITDQSIPTEYLHKYDGNYLIEDKYHIKLRTNDEKLIMKYGDQPEMQLYYESDGLFFAKDLKVDLKIRMEDDKTTIILKQGNVPFTLKKNLS
ncbi:MAG: beta-lactamase family protein [Candidatus Heimdallarchaeota archaeon]|nr:beta-lactamase family protein [Candidatus Heimdallarchaeota archaeon]